MAIRKQAPTTPQELIEALDQTKGADMKTNPIAVVHDDVEPLEGVDIEYAKETFRTTPDPYRESLPKKLLPKDVYAELKREAGMCGTTVANLLCKELSLELQHGNFSLVPDGEELAVGADEKRTGNDDNATNTEYQDLKRLLGPGTFAALRNFAKPHRLSNLAALVRGLTLLLAKRRALHLQESSGMEEDE